MDCFDPIRRSMHRVWNVKKGRVVPVDPGRQGRRRVVNIRLFSQPGKIFFDGGNKWALSPFLFRGGYLPFKDLVRVEVVCDEFVPFQ